MKLRGGVLVLALLPALLLAALAARLGPAALLAPIALAAALLGLSRPMLAIGYLLVLTFLRLAIPPDTFPVDPFLPAFAGVLVAVYVWPGTRVVRPPVVDAATVAMVLYVLWNVASALQTHDYPPGSPLHPEAFPLPRFILIGVVMPLAMHLVGRSLVYTASRIRALLWSLVGFGAYSALVSVLQFTGPARLVWPRYIVDSPTWPERAVGVFNQPVINGLTLVVGFLAALLLAVEGGYRKPVRVLALAVAAACVLGLYLTRTRVAWLAFVGVLLIGAVAGGRQRRYFVATLTAMTLGAVVMWGQLRSTDRQAGGLGSPTEVEDRLNGIATSLWAAQERPLTGWGIGRFESVNTFHHLQWSTEVPWKRGYGLASHFDVMGILVELGVIGVALWLAVLALVVAALVRAVRSLPPAGVADRPFALMALMAFVAWILTGLTVELRFFDYPNIVAMLVAGAAVGRARRTRDRPSSPTAGSAPSSLRTVAA